MIYYFQKLVGVVTFLTKIQKSEGNSTTLKNWIQKLEGKPTTLKNWIQKMEGNSTTPKNCVLTNFLHERSIIFLLVFSLIRFWILLWNVFLNFSLNFWSFDTPDTPKCASAVIWNHCLKQIWAFPPTVQAFRAHCPNVYSVHWCKNIIMPFCHSAGLKSQRSRVWIFKPQTNSWYTMKAALLMFLLKVS